MLFSFGKFLIRKLRLGSQKERLDLEDEVSLQYYRLQRISSGPIDLSGGDTIDAKSPTDVGTGKATEVKAPLSTFITILNEKFGTNFTEEDRLFFQQIKEKASRDNQVIQTALATRKTNSRSASAN